MLERLGLGLLAIVVLALFTLNIAAWRGRLIDEEPALRNPATSERPTTSETGPSRRRERPRARTIARPRRPPPEPREITLVLSATRGDCWVEARAGSAEGTVLFTGVLEQGRSLRFNRPRVWLSLGAASNVDVLVNGRQSVVPSGTVELTLPTA